MDEGVLSVCTYIIAFLFNLPLFLNTIGKKNSREDEKEPIKRVIALLGGLFFSLIFSTLILMPLTFASEINNNMVLFIYPIIVLSYLFIRLMVFIMNYLKVITSRYEGIYVRDIFVNYSPAVLSLLLNHKIEDKKDFDSTVLNIHAKKAIEFKRLNDKLEIVDLQSGEAITNLTEDEKYIYMVLTQKEKFDKQRWYNMIREELNKRNFVKKSQKSVIGQVIKASLILFCSIFLLLILFILMVLFIPGDLLNNIADNYFDYDIVLSVIWIVALIPFQLGTLKVLMFINKRNYLKDKVDYYTENGALEMLKWKKFKDFIKDFSMIDTTDAESVIIWEKYISYAMALNINKSYNSSELRKINETVKEMNWFI